MRRILTILTVLVFCVAMTLSAQTQTQNNETTVASSTTTSTTTVKTMKRKMPEVTKKQSPIHYELWTEVEGQNWLNEAGDAQSTLYITPGLHYKVNDMFTAGSELAFESNLNKINTSSKAHISDLSFFLKSKWWANNAGTSLTSHFQYHFDMITSKDNVDKGATRAYANLALGQAVGPAFFRARVASYYLTYNDFDTTKLWARPEIELLAAYTFNKYISASWRQKHRRYMITANDTASNPDPSFFNNWLVYNVPGVTLTFGDLIIDAYMYAIGTTQAKSWEAKTFSNATTFLDATYIF